MQICPVCEKKFKDGRGLAGHLQLCEDNEHRNFYASLPPRNYQEPYREYRPSAPAPVAGYPAAPGQNINQDVREIHRLREIVKRMNEQRMKDMEKKFDALELVLRQQNAPRAGDPRERQLQAELDELRNERDKDTEREITELKTQLQEELITPERALEMIRAADLDHTSLKADLHNQLDGTRQERESGEQAELSEKGLQAYERSLGHEVEHRKLDQDRKLKNEIADILTNWPSTIGESAAKIKQKKDRKDKENLPYQ